MTYVIFFAVSILASVVGAICGVGGEKRLWTASILVIQRRFSFLIRAYTVNPPFVRKQSFR